MIDVIQKEFIAGMYIKRKAAEEFEFSEVVKINETVLIVNDIFTDADHYQVKVSNLNEYWEFIPTSKELLLKVGARQEFDNDYYFYNHFSIDFIEDKFILVDAFNNQLKEMKWFHEVQGIIYFHSAQIPKISTKT